MRTALRQSALFGFAQAQPRTARVRSSRAFKRAPLLSLLVLLAILSPRPCAAQVGGAHTLFGDLKVEDTQKVGGLKPISFDLILYDIRGGMVARQTVVVNGRYRFEDVRNGDYEIVVMMESTEVARVRVSVYNAVATDVRRDIALEWKPLIGKQPEQPGVASVAEHYERSPSNERLFHSAEESVKKKELAQAAALLRQLVGADPKDFEAWTELGTVAFIQQDLAEADGDYQRALELRPTFGLALSVLPRPHWDAFDRLLDFGDERIQRDHVVLLDEDPIARQHLVVRAGTGAFDDLVPADRQDLIAARRRRPGNPDVLARQAA